MGRVLIELQRFRALLYGILTSAVDDQSPDIQMRQQMGIALSSATLKERGVLNIQKQSVAVKRVLVGVTEALKMLDAAEPIQVDGVAESDCGDGLQAIIDDRLAAATPLDDFLDQMTARYVEAAVRRFPTLKEAETVLGTTYQRFLKIRKKHHLVE